MNYAQFKQMQDQETISRVYSAMRNEEEFDYLSDNLLWTICKGWVEQDNGETFEDFIESYFWEP